MNKSEQIQELALALSDLQGELEDVYKNSEGYGYNYADLSSVLSLLRPLLKKHGLSVAQPVSGDTGTITITTMLMHKSGQYLSSAVTITIDVSNKKMNSLQAAGSTITYLRRYSLMSLIGLAATDDDGKSGGEHIDSERKELVIMINAHSLTEGPARDIIQKAFVHYGARNTEQLTIPQMQAIMNRINSLEGV